MSWYGDPDGLDGLASRLSGAAERLRDRRASVLSGAAATHWRGQAATAFRDALRRDLRVLDRAAGELEDAAGALRRHAEAVRAELARLRAIEHAAGALVRSGFSRLADTVP